MTVLSDGGLIRTCKTCEKGFVSYTQKRGMAPADHCPSCLDRSQCRPSVCLERECLWSGIVQVHSLPSEFCRVEPSPERIASGDHGYWQMDFSGSMLRDGSAWGGRIVAYSSLPVVPGMTLRLRDMVARHQVRAVRQTRPGYHGTVERLIEIPIVVADLPEPDGVWESEPPQETIAERPYLALEKCEPGDRADGELVWVTARTKTTLKGYGAQYWHRIEGAPIREWRVWSGARATGRFRTEGVLAVVNSNHPLHVHVRGDIQYDNWLPADAAPAPLA